MRLLRRLWYLVRRRDIEAGLDAELELHRELTEQRLRRDGRSILDASLEARRRLGNTALVRDDVRDAWGWRWLDDLRLDVRSAVRLLAKERRFTAAVVVALGLGIGLNNSVFTVINAALIRDVPFAEPDRLLDLAMLDKNGREVGLSLQDYRDWSGATTLEGVGVTIDAPMNLSFEGGAPARLRGTYVSANTFSLLRSRPWLGRDFLPEDDRPGAPSVVIVGYGVWQSRFGGDPAVIGRSVRVNNVPSTIVGVMPHRFSYPFINDAWQPLAAAPGPATSRADARPFRNVIARMTPRSDLLAAQAEIQAIAVAGARAADGLRSHVRLMRDGVGGEQARPILMTFMGAVAFVLLIACANVANLLLARSAARSRELAIRASLGATRWRIARALLVECLVLAALAGALGIVCSIYGAKALAVGFSVIEPGSQLGELMPFWIDLSLDRVVIGFVGVACLLSTLIFGLAPALQAAKVDVVGTLKDGGRGGTSGRGVRRWTSVFIVLEVALTVVLLAGAALLWRSFYAKYRTDLVVADDLITARLTLPVERYSRPEDRRRFFDSLQERLSTTAGFTRASLASQPPLGPNGAPRLLSIEGSPLPDGAKLPSVSSVYVGPGYFDTIGVGVRRGRGFTSGDGLPGREVAIVDERFAAQHLEGGDPIGRRIRLATDTPAAASAPWLTIVGVIPAVPDFSPPPLRRLTVHVPLAGEATPGADISILARSGEAVALAAASIRDEIRALDADLPIYGIERIEAAAERSRLPQVLVGRWFGVIALLGLVLSTVGVYALTAYAVAQRTQEIGVRVALGARPPQVVWLFLRRTAGHLAIGLTLGVCGALAAGRLLQSMLVDTSPRDPLTLASVVTLLAAVACVASLIPSRRAARLDPMEVLRM